MFDLGQQFLAGEGFLQISAVVFLAGWPDVTAGVEDPFFGPVLLDLFDELAAAHAGHDEVGDDEIDGSVIVVQLVQCFLTAGSSEDAVAVRGEDGFAHFEDEVFVIDHEDRLSAVEIAGGRIVGRGDGFLRRQVDADGGADTGFAGDSDIAAMIGDDAIDPGEADSAMISFRREEWFENSWQDFGFDAAAVVADLDTDICARGEFGVTILSCLAEFDIAGLDVDSAVSAD